MVCLYCDVPRSLTSWVDALMQSHAMCVTGDADRRRD
jgi:hypothetical protein